MPLPEMNRRVPVLLAIVAAVIVLGVMVVSRPWRSLSSSAAGPSADAGTKPANGSAEVDPISAEIGPARSTASNEATTLLEVHGRVLEHDGPEVGKPIAGAVVHVDGGKRDEQMVPADEEGSFRLTVNFASVRALRVEAEGYAGEELDSETLRDSAKSAGPKGIPFYLKRGSRIAGRVTADGTDVAGARVRCVQRGIYNSTDFDASVVSGSDGKFAVMCGNGEFKVQASHPEYQRGVTGWLTRDQTLTHPAVVELVRGSRLAGRVLDERGKPAVGVRLDLSDADAVQMLHGWSESDVLLPGRVLSDSRGEFAFEPVGGKLELNAWAPDRAAARMQLDLTVPRDRYVEVVLEAGGQVSGFVTLDGKPIESVMVGWLCQGDTSPESMQLTGARGTFHFKQLSRNVRCFVAAKLPDQSPFWNLRGARGGFLSTQVAADIGDDDVRLELNGEIPGSLRVVFEGKEKGYSGDFVLTGLDRNTEGAGVRKQTLYSPTDSLVISALPPGSYQLSAELDDGVNPEPRELSIRAGAVTEVTLTVPDGFARGKATGRVVDAAGKPLKAKVAFGGHPHSVFMSTTGPDGTFEFDYAAEHVSLSVSLDGYETVNFERAVGGGESASFGDIVLKSN